MPARYPVELLGSQRCGDDVLISRFSRPDGLLLSRRPVVSVVPRHRRGRDRRDVLALLGSRRRRARDDDPLVGLGVQERARRARARREGRSLRPRGPTGDSGDRPQRRLPGGGRGHHAGALHAPRRPPERAGLRRCGALLRQPGRALHALRRGVRRDGADRRATGAVLRARRRTGGTASRASSLPRRYGATSTRSTAGHSLLPGRR